MIIKQSEVFLKYSCKQTDESKILILAENDFQYRLTKTKGNRTKHGSFVYMAVCRNPFSGTVQLKLQITK